MPKGDNPNSRKNLKRPTEELRQRALNGSKKSAEVRAAYKSVKEVLMDLSTQIHTNAKGQKAQGFEIIGRKLFSMAQQGNGRALELYLKLCGELTTNVDVTTNGKDIAKEPLVVKVLTSGDPIKKVE